MLSYFYVENYKCLDSLVLDNLKLINVITGKNNVGKTTVLEAIFTFFDRNSANIGLKPLLWRGMIKFPGRPTEFWSPIFRNYNVQQPIKMKLRTDEGLNKELAIELIENFASKFIAVGLNSTVQNNTVLQVKYKIDEEETQNAHLILTGNQILREVENPESETVRASLKEDDAVFLGSIQRTDLREDIDRYSQLVLKNLDKKVLEYLTILEPNLRSIETIAIDGMPVLIADTGFGRKIPINYLGGGVVRLFSFLVTALFRSHAYIFIDEFENGFHYSILPKVWESIIRLAQDQGSQIFVSTHSYECLKACCVALEATKSEENFSYFRIERSTENGKEKLLSKWQPYKNVKTSLDSGWEIR